MRTPSVSIVIPTCNGVATLPALFDAIASQQVDFPFEVLAVDSSSTDGTAALVRDRADRVVTVAGRTFDHGLTRNLGIEQAGGDLIVLTVQDALPTADSWLARLTAPFASDARLAGTFARQVPRPDASPVTRYYHSRWAASADAPRIAEVSGAAEFDALGPVARFERCIFDNVCSCVRRSVWRQHPFRSTPIGEDVVWAKEVLLAGYRLAYVPGAAVRHSHDRSALYEFKRTYVLHRVLSREFQLRTIPTLPLLARSVATSLALHARCERRAGAAVPSARAMALALAWPLGQYCGGLSSARGWMPAKARGV
jgi:rhamnosyltransferase